MGSEVASEGSNKNLNYHETMTNAKDGKVNMQG